MVSGQVASSHHSQTWQSGPRLHAEHLMPRAGGIGNALGRVPQGLRWEVPVASVLQAVGSQGHLYPHHAC